MPHWGHKQLAETVYVRRGDDPFVRASAANAFLGGDSGRQERLLRCKTGVDLGVATATMDCVLFVAGRATDSCDFMDKAGSSGAMLDTHGCWSKSSTLGLFLKNDGLLLNTHTLIRNN